MKFDLFVLPFISGLVFVFIYTGYKFISWIKALNVDEKQKLKSHFFSKQIGVSIKEIFQESLMHQRVFKVYHLLGYMHMSLAFGWFMLIAIGNIEIKFYSGYTINPPYVPIFLRFFETNPLPHFFGRGSNFLMDLLLLFILSGVGLALYKRIRAKSFGLKRVTKHSKFDRLALISLWLIFPLRLLAESFTSGIYQNGSFLTGTIGDVFANFLPLEVLVYPAWWAYSIALGCFFFALPFSRYMHIPAELLLIVLRNAGIKPRKTINSYSKVEIHSCSRCGICIDPCQIAHSNNITTIQPSYFFRDIRYNQLQPEVVENCLMCGRCNSYCPVGINSTTIRQEKRIEINNFLTTNYTEISQKVDQKTDILYFAGCMTNLTKGIKKSMETILDNAGIKWQYLDKDGTVCCGRPLILSGLINSANDLILKNTENIKFSGAKTLVTSCPICYKAFKEEYKLDIEILHHSQFLKRLIEEGKIKVAKTNITTVYHDPCELGRGSGIYDEPRFVINKIAAIKSIENEKEKSLCCGGSIGNIKISNTDKKKIAEDALIGYNLQNADMLVTACPLCKKTFDSVSKKPVMDIAQLVAANMVSTKTNESLCEVNIQETEALI